jgi:hypothetical protein
LYFESLFIFFTVSVLLCQSTWNTLAWPRRSSE